MNTQTANDSSRWVPVTERLPTHIYSVLIWVVGPTEATCGEPFREIGIYNASRGKWQCCLTGDGDTDVEVSHWMDLPEASWRPPEQAVAVYCKCSFVDDDGSVVPGEPCPIHNSH
jgi:hypothetical protein